MIRRYVCVHGHFYQPPQENPWLESIERQESAHPYHDWNERVTAECYAPNAASRIFDDRQRIVEIVNNYSRISFNVGPTLLSWMEAHARVTYRAILDADRESRECYIDTLEALAEHGIRFTVLAPRQAAEVRRLDGADGPWHDVSGSNVDPVAFEELTRNGERRVRASSRAGAPSAPRSRTSRPDWRTLPSTPATTTS